MSEVRIEVDQIFNCRAKRGERRGPGGRLIKCSINFAPSLAIALAEAIETRAAGDRMAPGYSSVIAVRVYDRAAYMVDPLKAVPFYSAATL